MFGGEVKSTAQSWPKVLVSIGGSSTGLSVLCQDPKGILYLSKRVNEGEDLLLRKGHEEIFSHYNLGWKEKNSSENS